LSSVSPSAMLCSLSSQLPTARFMSKGWRRCVLGTARLIKHLICVPRNWIMYAGAGRLCPVCGRSSRAFAPFGHPVRRDAQCVWCLSLERHRLMSLYIERRLAPFAGTPHALHVAPEPCLQPALRRLFGRGYASADVQDPGADLSMDITGIQFPDESFDFIYCSHVLEHVEDDRQAMSEFRRVLKKGGVAILLVPVTDRPQTFGDPTIIEPQARQQAFGQRDHVRVYGADYPTRLQESGFEVEVVRVEDLATPNEADAMNLGEAAGVIYVCRRGTLSFDDR
jgi:SAM-dependent methyltransferase